MTLMKFFSVPKEASERVSTIDMQLVLLIQKKI